MFDVRGWMLDAFTFLVPHSPPGRGSGVGYSAFRLQRYHASTLQRPNTPMLPRSPIQRTPHAQARLLHHVRVKLRRRHVFVP